MAELCMLGELYSIFENWVQHLCIKIGRNYYCFDHYRGILLQSPFLKSLRCMHGIRVWDICFQSLIWWKSDKDFELLAASLPLSPIAIKISSKIGSRAGNFLCNSLYKFWVKLQPQNRFILICWSAKEMCFQESRNQRNFSTIKPSEPPSGMWEAASSMESVHARPRS